MMEVDKSMGKNRIISKFNELKSEYKRKIEEIKQLDKKIEKLERDQDFYKSYYTINERPQEDNTESQILSRCETCEDLIEKLDHSNKMRGNLGNKFGTTK